VYGTSKILGTRYQTTASSGREKSPAQTLKSAGSSTIKAFICCIPAERCPSRMYATYVLPVGGGKGSFKAWCDAIPRYSPCFRSQCIPVDTVTSCPSYS